MGACRWWPRRTRQISGVQSVLIRPVTVVSWTTTTAVALQSASTASIFCHLWSLSGAAGSASTASDPARKQMHDGIIMFGDGLWSESMSALHRAEGGATMRTRITELVNSVLADEAGVGAHVISCCRVVRRAYARTSLSGEECGL